MLLLLVELTIQKKKTTHNDQLKGNVKVANAFGTADIKSMKAIGD